VNCGLTVPEYISDQSRFQVNVLWVTESQEEATICKEGQGAAGEKSRSTV